MVLYFIRIINENKVKVGVTDRWDSRIRNIQTGGGYPPDKMVFKKFDVENAKNLENTLKINFRDFNIIGEWFYDENLVKFFFDKVFNFGIIDEELIYITLRKFQPEGILEIKPSKTSIYIPKNYDFSCYLEELTEQQQYTLFIASEGELHLYDYNIFYKVSNDYYSWYFKDKLYVIKDFLNKNNIDYIRMDLEKGEIVDLPVKKYRPMKRLNRN